MSNGYSKSFYMNAELDTCLFLGGDGLHLLDCKDVNKVVVS